MCKLNASDRNKLGNTCVYMAQRIPDLSKTKLLKMLYFMEEYSVMRFKTPFLGLPFEVWQAGPVVKDVFVDLSEIPVLLDGFVKRVQQDGATYVEPVTEFCDDEFSDNDIIVMDDVIKRYGHMTAKELVQLTHQEGSPWWKVAKENGLLEAFNDKLMNNSVYTIDFAEVLPKCSREFYLENLEFLRASRAYVG